MIKWYWRRNKKRIKKILKDDVIGKYIIPGWFICFVITTTIFVITNIIPAWL